METFNLSLFKAGIWSPNGITKSKHPLQRSTAKDCFLGKESMQQRGWVPGGHCHPLPSTATQQPSRAPQSGMVYPCIINFHQFFICFFHIFPIELDITWYILEVSIGIHRYPGIFRHDQPPEFRLSMRPCARWCHLSWSYCSHLWPCCLLANWITTAAFAYEIPLVFLDVFGVFLEM